MEKYTDYYSAVVLGCGNNNGILLKSSSEYVFKSYYKLRSSGEGRYRLFFVNRVESTGNCRAEKMGDGYVIEEAYAACSPDEEHEDIVFPITFGGNKGKRVMPGEEFSSDEFDFTYSSSGYMVLTFKVKTEGRKFLPATEECASRGRVFENGREVNMNNFTLRPAFIGLKRDFKKTVGFWGDSITQGARTRVDKYEAWVHRIGNALEEDISIWNIGMGWARAYDAALGGVFTKKALMCDEVFICFGVNDLKSGGRCAEEIIDDLKTAQRLLKAENEDIVIHLLTVPPFNMTEIEEENRQRVNEYIKNTPGYFDIAKYLEGEIKGEVRGEFMSPGDDPHPNGEGGRAICEGFFEWRQENQW